MKGSAASMMVCTAVGEGGGGGGQSQQGGEAGGGRPRRAVRCGLVNGLHSSGGGGRGGQSQQGEGVSSRGAAAADHLLSHRASCRFISYRNHGFGNLIVAVFAHGALQGDTADSGGDHSLRKRG